MRVQRDFEPEPESAQAVRRFVEGALAGEPFLDDILLTASEFATNVIRHARTPFTVRLISADDKVRVEVSDGSSIIPAVEDLSESYRGLRMIDAVSTQWGVDATESGKTVWAEFADTSRRRA
ncbi:MAG TPA: ATP-binding protein [Acidimicrobiia bacterium]|nr:ATP-binding protein [Acidimicrobiia bacterium]